MPSFRRLWRQIARERRTTLSVALDPPAWMQVLALATGSCDLLTQTPAGPADASAAIGSIRAALNALGDLPEDAPEREFPLMLAAHARSCWGSAYPGITLLVLAAAEPALRRSVRRWTPQIVQTPTDLLELIAAWNCFFGPIAGPAQRRAPGPRFPRALQRGLIDALHAMPPTSLRAAAHRRQPSLRDALRLLHPTPRDGAEEQLFAALIEGRTSPPLPTHHDRCPELESLRALPRMLESGSEWRHDLDWLNEPIHWPASIWPVHLLRASERVATLLPAHHPWSSRRSAGESEVRAIPELTEALAWLSRAFVARANLLPKIAGDTGIAFVNAPELRTHQLLKQEATLFDLGLSLQLALMYACHKFRTYLVFPAPHRYADSLPEDPLLLGRRMRDKGRHSGSPVPSEGWAPEISFEPPTRVINISADPFPATGIVNDLPLPDGAYQLWLTPIGAPLAHARDLHQYAGGSWALLETLLLTAATGQSWTEVIADAPLGRPVAAGLVR